MARCYANENFPFPTVEALRGLGHDVLTTVESGRAGQAMPDADVLAFAVAEDRIVITLNRRHFIRLHYTTPTHAGIIVGSFQIPVDSFQETSGKTRAVARKTVNYFCPVLKDA